MFKKKKFNENAIKKDFFAVKKKPKTETFVNVKENFKGKKIEMFSDVSDLGNLKLPKPNEIFFVRTKASREQRDFLKDKFVQECFCFCSRLSKRSFEIFLANSLKGLGLSERVLQKNPLLYKEAKEKTEIKLSNNHTKMLIFRTIFDEFIVISGSGNPSKNARKEFYILENNEEKYNLIKNWFENV